MALTTEQEVERKQQIDAARAKPLHERTQTERILVQEADLADATAAARAAEAAANTRQWQYETETFLLRNPTFIDSTANVERLKSLLAAKGWGWDAKSMEFVFRNSPEGTFHTPQATVVRQTEPDPVRNTYDLTPEAIRKITPAQMTEIRRHDPRKYQAITEAISDIIARVGGGLARKFFNGHELSETEQFKFNEAMK
jgi:hypothetical protein